MAKAAKVTQPEMPALKPTLRKVSTLHPHPKNPNTHPDSQIEGLGSAYYEFGVTSIVVVDEEGQILAGEGRIKAAKKRGIKEYPVVVVEGWSEEKKLAFMTSDNQWARLSVWDQGRLLQNVETLELAKYDMALVGFDAPALAQLRGLSLVPPEEEGDRGALLELVNITIAEPTHVVERGDHYLLGGRHHLFCESVISGWQTWTPLLKGDALFCPYPGVFVPFGDKAKVHELIMVQADPYIAGHMLDRWVEAYGKKAVRKIAP